MQGPAGSLFDKIRRHDGERNDLIVCLVMRPVTLGRGLDYPPILVQPSAKARRIGCSASERPNKFLRTHRKYLQLESESPLDVFLSRLARTWVDLISEMDSQEANPELESFREKWRAEVRARNTASSGSQQQASANNSHANSSHPTTSLPPRSTHLNAGKAKVLDTDDDYVQERVFDDAEPQPAARQAEQEVTDPVTALEHYEHAAAREAEGSLGDSLRLYRKAFRVRITVFL